MTNEQPVTDQPTITAEQIAAYQRQQAAQEQRAMQACIVALQALASEHGFEIAAKPLFTHDGRTVADWGVVRKVQ